jgi:hypothetical protein
MYNCPFTRNRINTLSAAYPVRKDTKNPVAIVMKFIEIFAPPCVFNNSKMDAPRIDGIARRNEYNPENFRDAPEYKLADIVAPEREIPGSIASICTTPIKIGYPNFNCSTSFSPFEIYLVKNKMDAVIKRKYGVKSGR